MYELRLGSFSLPFFLGDRQISGGDEFEVSDINTARHFLSALGCTPVDGDWLGVVPPVTPPTTPDRDRRSAKQRKQQRVRPAAACPCEPGPRPKDLRRTTKQACAVPGCGCQVWRAKCRAHARTSTTTGQTYGTGHRNVSADLRRKWERERKAYLRAHPYCECAECLLIPAPLRPAATEVDHIDGLGLLGPLAFDPDNLQALTKAHHSRKTAGESFGH
jgi:hypothetical protein